jgi:hypothetical protein
MHAKCATLAVIMEDKMNAYRILMGKPLGKRSLRRARKRLGE